MNDPKHLRGAFNSTADARRAARVIQIPLDIAGREALIQICETAVIHHDRELNEKAAAILRKSCMVRRATDRVKGN